MLLKNIFFDRASNHHIQFKVDRLQIILVAKKYISIRVGAIHREGGLINFPPLKRGGGAYLREGA